MIGKTLKAVIFVGIVCMGIPWLGAERLLKSWDFTNHSLPPDLGLHCERKQGAEARMAPAPSVVHPGGSGALLVSVSNVAAEKPFGSHIQLMFVTRVALSSNRVYGIAFLCRASQKANFVAQAMLTSSPWTLLSPKSTRAVAADTNWQEVSFDFKPTMDLAATNGIRTPCLYLGTVPRQTSVWVARVRFCEK